QPGNLNRTSGWLYIARHEGSIDLVEGGVVVHILQEAGRFYDMVHTGASVFQQALERFQHTCRLSGDIVTHDLATFRIGGNYTRGVKHAGERDRLGVGSDRGRCLVGCHRIELGHGESPSIYERGCEPAQAFERFAAGITSANVSSVMVLADPDSRLKM